ncbi:hypothetical protein HDU77_001777 [Chytriomyces hyalinus]|nr:hypothetical protein HDU77_001777 [Chytriomyces hyalinus]
MSALGRSPFTINGNKTAGSPWVIAPAESVWRILDNFGKPNVAGYGCFVGPTSPLGYAIDFTLNGTSPEVTASNICRPGFFCPYLNVSNPATYPVVCPALPKCHFDRQFGDYCEYPQGLFEPMPCPIGFYCPDYNTVLVCPAGSYCPTGSTVPRPCPFLSSCPAGSGTQAHYGTVVIVLALDFLLFLGYVALRIRERMRAEPDKPLFSFAAKQTNAAEPSKSNVTISDVDNNIKALTAGFEKGLDGHKDLSMYYEFENLCLRLPDGKEILQGVSGSIRAGRMTAIMGPSGAGKTTFMNVLMGKIARTAGTLKINNAVAEMKYFRKLVGYVPQEDIMIEELSVRENIRYAARIRLPDSWSNKQVDEHVDAILTALNLQHVAHKRIGSTLVRGISGGQRKRVNIGMELAAAPLSVFLDEPTSGLDSTSALDVANILHSISRLGLTIVAVVHQPRVEIFEAFDDVLMIAPGGLTAYFGPIAGAQAHFEALGFVFQPGANVADTLMDILAGRGEVRAGVNSNIARPSEIVKDWKMKMSGPTPSVVARAVPVESSIETMRLVAKLRGASFLKQVGISHNRSIVQQSRLIGAFVIESFVGFLTGGIMGVASGGGESFTGILIAPYQLIGAAPRYWFIGMYGMLIGISISLAATPSGVKVFSEEKAVYLREAEAGHNSTAYFIGKNISTTYRVLLSSAHFVAIFYYLSQPPIDLGIEYVLIFLNFLGAYGLGMIVSMLVRRENAPLLAVTTALISEVLCGFGPTLKFASKNGIMFLYDIGVNRWMAEAQYALWVEAFSNIADLPIAGNAFGYVFGKTGFNIGIMVVVCVAYRVVTYLLFLSSIHATTLKAFFTFKKKAVEGKKEAKEDGFLEAN